MSEAVLLEGLASLSVVAIDILQMLLRSLYYLHPLALCNNPFSVQTTKLDPDHAKARARLLVALFKVGPPGLYLVL